MKDWIKKNIAPPGMEKKNRGSLFSLIARVFGIVRDDAIKTFNAFFPYLADSEKLKEHGDILSIPKLPYDTEDDYRNRVAAASFYLMKAGGRAYIHSQLKRRFGDRYFLTEEFLQIFITILDARNENIFWLRGFLDRILDPNISFSIRRNPLKFNGAAKFDGETLTGKIMAHGRFDGGFNFNDDLGLRGLGKKRPEQLPSTPFTFSSGLVEILPEAAQGSTFNGQAEFEDDFV